MATNNKSKVPNLRNTRIRRELKLARDSPDGGEITFRTVGDDLYNWTGRIAGPRGTPYEGGWFVLGIYIPPEYPIAPPKIHFETKIWHPNISSQTGAICLDILKSEWSPTMTIRTALVSIQALLSAPEPDDPQDAEVASMYKRSIAEFESTARMWTRTFSENQESNEEKIQKIIQMGFSEEQAKEALTKHNWNETLALNHLL